jgi:hypothetical protein
MAEIRRLYWLCTGITAACLLGGTAASVGVYYWVTKYPHTVVEAVLLLCCGIFGRLIYREVKRGFGWSEEERTKFRRVA